MTEKSEKRVNLRKMSMERRRKYIIKRWVAALRSGSYAQGKTYLNCNGEYCCLGVLCEVILKEDPEFMTKHAVNLNLPPRDIAIAYDGQRMMLPEKVMDLLGISAEGNIEPPLEVRGKTLRALSIMNDHLDYSFDDLANFIEEHSERIFNNSR